MSKWKKGQILWMKNPATGTFEWLIHVVESTYNVDLRCFVYRVADEDGNEYPSDIKEQDLKPAGEDISDEPNLKYKGYVSSSISFHDEFWGERKPKPEAQGLGSFPKSGGSSLFGQRTNEEEENRADVEDRTLKPVFDSFHLSEQRLKQSKSYQVPDLFLTFTDNSKDEEEEEEGEDDEDDDDDSLPPAFARNRNRQYMNGPKLYEGTVKGTKSRTNHTLKSPQTYFRVLKDTRDEVYRRSALSAFNASNRYVRDANNPLRVFFPQNEFPTAISDAMVLEVCDAETKSSYAQGRTTDTSNPDTELLIEVLECRNIVAVACANVQRLQHSNFITDRISIIVADERRPSVANLVPLPVGSIQTIFEMFCSAVYHRYLLRTRPRDSLPAEIRSFLIEKQNLLTGTCAQFLHSLGFTPSPNALGKNDDNLSSIAECWRCAADIIDLAVLSYAGAHVDTFDGKVSQESTSQIEIPVGKAFSESEQAPEIKKIQLERRSAKCLDGFLGGHQIWVFREIPQFFAGPLNSLYLSAKMEDFADI